MSDSAYYEDQYESARENAGLGMWIAAIVSLALLAGVIVWAYRLGTQDAHEVPVIKALAAPMKARPADPGGLKLETTDLAVNRMTAESDGASESATLALPPERPGAEDRSAAEREAEAIEAAVREAAAAQAERDRLAAETRELQSEETRAALALSDSGATAGSTGVVELTPAPTTSGAATTDVVELQPADITAAIVENDAPRIEDFEPTAFAPGASPVAAARPSRLNTSAKPVQVAALSAGDLSIQLGAYNSEALAMNAWRAQMGRNADLLDGLSPSVSSVTRNGATFYRLRVGPVASADQASAICGKLKERGGDCILARIQ